LDDELEVVEEADGTESDSSVEAPRRQRVMREAVKNAKPWNFFKRPKRPKVIEYDRMSTEDDIEDDTLRCVTCVKTLEERIWYGARYFDHCQR
jgi:hypothetical protein